MKLKKFLIIFFISMFCFMFDLSAKSTYSCNKEVEVGSNIICNITIENDPVMIESDGNIDIIKTEGDSYFKRNEFQVVFYESGTVEFGPALDKYSKYFIYLNSEDGNLPYDKDTRVSVIAKTTKRTTTTTTKKTTTTKVKSSNNYLSDIKIDGNSLENFDKNLLKYSLTVPYETDSVEIEVTKEDETSMFEITGPDMLKVGNNVYTISVTSEDNTTKFYKIYITKEDEISSDASIKEIIVKNYKLKLDNNSKTYHLNIKEDVNSLDIDVLTNSDKASVSITGNENLKNGSVIKIIVTAQNNDTSTYRIIINKIKEEKKSIMPYIITGISIFIIILIVVIIVIKKKKNDNKKTKDSNKNLDETKTFNENVSENNQDETDEEKTKEVIINEKE